jgi:(E)-4-hydroxy-3-methylbut-2-enyl-diphosphate synthase
MSAIGLSWLLKEGIGDTMRVSLAADPVEEVRVAFDILKVMKLRTRGINFIACPTCSRRGFDVIGTVNELEKRLGDVTESLNVAVMGCVVNGPGEASRANLGVCGAAEKSYYYEDGERLDRIPNEQLIDELERRIRAYLAKKQA